MHDNELIVASLYSVYFFMADDQFLGNLYLCRSAPLICKTFFQETFNSYLIIHYFIFFKRYLFTVT